MHPRRIWRKGGVAVMVSGQASCARRVLTAGSVHAGAARAGAAGRGRGGLQRDRRRRDAAARPEGAVGAPGQDRARDRAGDVPAAVPYRIAPGGPPTVTEAWRAELVRVVELDPRAVGVKRAVWTTRLLAAYPAGATGVAVSPETVRRRLHAAGDVCTRPTGTLKRKAAEQAEDPGNAPGWRRSWRWHRPPLHPSRTCWPTWRPGSTSRPTSPACWRCCRGPTCTCRTSSRPRCTRP